MSTRPPEHDQISIGSEIQTSLGLAHNRSQVIEMGNPDLAEESASELSTSPSASSSGAAPDFLLALFAVFLAFFESIVSLNSQLASGQVILHRQISLQNNFGAIWDYFCDRPAK